MAEKKFWRCTVCGDLHHGAAAPDPCPTCHSPGSQAEEISREDFLESLE